MTHRLHAVAILFAFAATSAARAQSARALAAQGMSAYHMLDYDVAAALLSRALAGTGVLGLADSSRASAYMYLGAAEFFRGRSGAAASAFDQALAAYPRHRADTLVFPPDVTRLFDDVRRQTAYVSLQAVPETVLVVGKPGRIARVYASAPHPIVADLVAERESRSRAIYAGAIGDSLDIRWDGRAAEDQAPLTGHLTLRVASWSPAGRESVVKLVLQVTSVMPDTLAHPPPPLEPDSGVVAQAREPRGTWPAVRALVVGAFGSAAAVALARVFPDEPASGNGPYVVAGALGLMGIVGFVAQRPTSLSADHGLPDQVRAWRRQVAEIRRLNEERRQIVRLKVVPLPAAGS